MNKTQKLCSKCGSPLDESLRCWSEVCGYRPRGSGPVVAGRYRHPQTAEGRPCICNLGHIVG